MPFEADEKTCRDKKKKRERKKKNAKNRDDIVSDESRFDERNIARRESLLSREESANIMISRYLYPRVNAVTRE